MSALQVIAMFLSVNDICQRTGESVVPMTKENEAYYRDQMDNLDIDDATQDIVIATFGA